MRETYGIAAYRVGDFKTASRELRTAQRITGDFTTLPMLADAERGLGRPEKALDIAASDAAGHLDAELTIEMMIVVAGAYADTGDIETALHTVEIPALRHRINGRWPVRLWVAYADLLQRAGRPEESRKWVTLAADADTEGLTDAAERLGRPAPVAAPSMWDSIETLTVVDAYTDEIDEELDSSEAPREDDSERYDAAHTTTQEEGAAADGEDAEAEAMRTVSAEEPAGDRHGEHAQDRESGQGENRAQAEGPAQDAAHEEHDGQDEFLEDDGPQELDGHDEFLEDDEPQGHDEHDGAEDPAQHDDYDIDDFDLDIDEDVEFDEDLDEAFGARYGEDDRA